MFYNTIALIFTYISLLFRHIPTTSNSHTIYILFHIYKSEININLFLKNIKINFFLLLFFIFIFIINFNK